MKCSAVVPWEWALIHRVFHEVLSSSTVGVFHGVFSSSTVGVGVNTQSTTAEHFMKHSVY